MTEAEWAACVQPWMMLNYLRPRRPDKRRLRLFACACIRRHWARLDNDGGRRAVEAVERFADGLIGPAEFQAAGGAAAAAAQDGERRFRAASRSMAAVWAAHGAWNAALAASQAAGVRALNAAAGAASYMRAAARDFARITVPASIQNERTVEAAEAAAQAVLLRDVFNPFGPAPRIDPAWLAWNDGAVRKLAQVVYDDCAFDRLPLLADALEDAGCTDADLLAHLRGPGPHVRGCWPLGLLLGKG